MFQNLFEIKVNFKKISQCKSTHNAPISDLAMVQHLSDNKICRKKFDINWFSILATRQSSFHLATLEATFIESFKPSLCQQKEFVYELKLSHLPCK